MPLRIRRHRAEQTVCRPWRGCSRQTGHGEPTRRPPGRVRTLAGEATGVTGPCDMSVSPRDARGRAEGVDEQREHAGSDDLPPGRYEGSGALRIAPRNHGENGAWRGQRGPRESTRLIGGTPARALTAQLARSRLAPG